MLTCGYPYFPKNLINPTIPFTTSTVWPSSLSLFTCTVCRFVSTPVSVFNSTNTGGFFGNITIRSGTPLFPGLTNLYALPPNFFTSVTNIFSISFSNIFTPPATSTTSHAYVYSLLGALGNTYSVRVLFIFIFLFFIKSLLTLFTYIYKCCISAVFRVNIFATILLTCEQTHDFSNFLHFLSLC